jgi:hypothetical protein
MWFWDNPDLNAKKNERFFFVSGVDKLTKKNLSFFFVPPIENSYNLSWIIAWSIQPERATTVYPINAEELNTLLAGSSFGVSSFGVSSRREP